MEEVEMKRVSSFPHTKAQEAMPDKIPNADALCFSATLSACTWTLSIIESMVIGIRLSVCIITELRSQIQILPRMPGQCRTRFLRTAWKSQFLSASRRTHNTHSYRTPVSLQSMHVLASLLQSYCLVILT